MFAFNKNAFDKPTLTGDYPSLHPLIELLKLRDILWVNDQFCALVYVTWVFNGARYRGKIEFHVWEPNL